MLSTTSSTFRRRFAQVAVAGALAAAPIGALAATASAEALESTASADVTVAPADAVGGEIADRPHRGDHNGPRVRFHHPGDHPGDHRGPDGPPNFFLPPSLPTGSAG
ncbi:hypothetical protein [Nocardia aurea]|uniref:Uncharacterized protein n=1 Tax=Nocardia aurea TaxID=2144174 RepID=A0ABV3FN13_9NOCA